MIPFVVAAEATADIERVAAYMERQRRGYGETFEDTVGLTIERIQRTPGVFKRLPEHLRRCPMRRFSYYVYFRVEPHCIFILRIIHTSRDQDKALRQKPKPKKPRKRTES